MSIREDRVIHGVRTLKIFPVAERSKVYALHVQTCRLQAVPERRGRHAPLLVQSRGVYDAIVILEH